LLDHYNNLGWLCDLVYRSNDQRQNDVRIVTSLKVKADGLKVTMTIRDPSTLVSLVEKQILTDLCEQYAEWNQLTLAKSNPSNFFSKDGKTLKSRLRNEKKNYKHLLQNKLRVKQSAFFARSAAAKLEEDWVKKHADPAH